MIVRAMARCPRHRFEVDRGSVGTVLACTRCGVHGQSCRCRQCQHWGPLTPREVELADSICEGRSRYEVSEQMGISTRTYDTHRAHVMDKLGVANEVQLLLLAIRRGWVVAVRDSDSERGPGEASVEVAEPADRVTSSAEGDPEDDDHADHDVVDAVVGQVPCPTCMAQVGVGCFATAMERLDSHGILRDRVLHQERHVEWSRRVTESPSSEDM